MRDGLDVVSSVEVQPAVSALPAKEPDHDQSLSLCVEEGHSVKAMEGSSKMLKSFHRFLYLYNIFHINFMRMFLVTLQGLPSNKMK